MFKVLGWQFPAHIFDQHTAYLAASNLLLPYEPEEEKKRKKQRRPYRMPAGRMALKVGEHIDKATIAEDIGNGNWCKYGREVAFQYCEEDVRKGTELLRAQVRGAAGFAPIDVPRVLHWSKYSAKAIALIQARGMPIDTKLWDLVQENKAAVIRELIRQFDPSYGSEYPISTSEGE